MTDLQLETQAEMLINKTQHYLITTMGVTTDEATDDEFYRAFSLTVREEIMINWTATMHTIKNNKARCVYYLCMEYMPGRLLSNNITNINANELVRYVMKKLNRDFKKELLIEPDPGLGNGGLGRLASCLLDSLATQQYPAVGYGLRYQYGIFDQEIWGGMQVERPEIWLLNENPWEFRRDVHAVTVKYAGRAIPKKTSKNEEVYDLVDHEEVRALSYDIPIIGYRDTPDFNVVTLRLWTTKESPRNFQLQRYNAGLLDQAAENTTLTDVLYPNDNNDVGKRIRLKQEFLLASASVQDILLHHLKSTKEVPDFADRVRIHINDTHPSFAIVELARMLMQNYDLSWGETWEIVKTCCNYTNHTVLKESLEEWNVNRFNYLLPRQYHILERLNLEFCNSVRQKFPNDEERVRRMSIIENGQVRMANLAIYASHRVNGVAALHTEILKKTIFKDFYEMYPDKFVNVTNGVTQRRWLLNANPRLANFLIKRIGKGWITDFTQINGIAKYATDPDSQQQFWEIKKANKRDLIEYLRNHDAIRDSRGKIVGFFGSLDDDALFDVQVKRVHEYKRQLMNALHALMLYYELKENPNARKIKRMILFAGKAAPGYTMARNIIDCIYCIARKVNNDPDVNTKLRVVFVENYNVSRAELIIPAADLSEQISTAGMEASGTGNMKLAINGALTIGTEDGANIEMHKQINKWWPFGFGKTAQENEDARTNRSYNPWDIYLNNNAIKRAVDTLRDHSIAQTEEEHQVLSSIYHSLLESQYGDIPDRYFVLRDLPAYYDTQKKVEELYANPTQWAEYALQNIASMGPFSSDESIKNYAHLVWGITPCPVDPAELSRVRQLYSEHDKCRIL